MGNDKGSLKTKLPPALIFNMRHAQCFGIHGAQ